MIFTILEDEHAISLYNNEELITWETQIAFLLRAHRTKNEKKENAFASKGNYFVKYCGVFFSSIVEYD